MDIIKIPNKGVFAYKPSPALTEYKEKAAALTARIKKQNLGPKIWHDSFDRSERINMYAPNEGLAIPYVSPMLAESLCDLPPLLLVSKKISCYLSSGFMLKKKSLLNR